MEDKKTQLSFNRYLIYSLLMMTLIVAGCGKKEPPKTDSAPSDGFEKQDSAGKGRPDGIEHKILSFNLEGMTEKGEKKW
ncbi:MAG: hypothetical protein WC482_02720, partial [Candidatus Omnitrophota bacterium]